MATTPLTPWIFAALMTVGVLYFLFKIVFGGFADSFENADIHLDGADVGEHGETGESGQFTTMIVAAFLAMFGAAGLLGSLSGWGLLLTLAVALVVGIIAGWSVLKVLRFVLNQQSRDSIVKAGSVIGKIARITIDTPPGKTGEAMLEGAHIDKYPVKEINGAELKRGDSVEVVDLSGPYLYVKKKRSS